MILEKSPRFYVKLVRTDQFKFQIKTGEISSVLLDGKEQDLQTELDVIKNHTSHESSLNPDLVYLHEYFDQILDSFSKKWFRIIKLPIETDKILAYAILSPLPIKVVKQ